MATEAIKKIYKGVVSYLQYWRGIPIALYRTIQDIPFYIRNPYDEDITVTFEKDYNDTSTAWNYHSVNVYYKNSPDPSRAWTLLGTTIKKSTEYPTINIPAHSTIYFGGEPLDGDGKPSNEYGWGYRTPTPGTSGYVWNIIKGAPIVGGNILSLLRRNDFVKNHTINEYSFYNLFRGTTLIDAGELYLPSTTLAKGCYREMFLGNSSLAVAPKLPATTLATECYREMFRGNSSLVNAPALPAPILTDYCYYHMFYNSGVQNVTCLAEDRSADSCTTGWLYGVPRGGVLTKKAGVYWPINNTGGIPAGWTSIDV